MLLDDMKTLAERIKHIRRVLSKEYGHTVTQVELATIAGVKKQNVWQWEAGNVKSIDWEAADRLEKRTGFRVQWIQKGTGPERTMVQEAPGDYSGPVIRVPVFEIGLEDGRSTVLEEMPLSLAWLRAHVSFSSPQNLGITTARGNTMLDTFAEGDILLIDRGVKDIKADGVYALRLHEDTYVRRIQHRPDGGVMMLADNKLYEPYQFKASDLSRLTVIGRAIWVWRGRPL
jgi:transcriptional regulator with XRE-family HTH domain